MADGKGEVAQWVIKCNVPECEVSQQGREIIHSLVEIHREREVSDRGREMVHSLVELASNPEVFVMAKCEHF